MRQEPPFMSDEEADNTWRRGVETSMSSRHPSIDDLQAQIDRLQHQIAQRQHIERATAPRQPDAHTRERFSRQGRETNTSDDLPKRAWDQSDLRTQEFFNTDQPEVENTSAKTSELVVKGQKRLESKNKNWANQSSSSKDPSRTRQSSPKQTSGQKKGAESADSGTLADQDALKGSLKRKHANDFGGRTFWNRPSNPKRTSDRDPKALALNDSTPHPDDLIIRRYWSVARAIPTKINAITHECPILEAQPKTICCPPCCERSTTQSHRARDLHDSNGLCPGVYLSR
jgi:hypothetical protein